jgi:hypothetical protein
MTSPVTRMTPKFPAGFAFSKMLHRVAVRLTRRAGMYRIEPVKRELNRISLNKVPERVSWLRVQVHPGHLEPSPVISGSSPAGS